MKFFNITLAGVSLLFGALTAFPEKSFPEAMEVVSMAPSAEIIPLPPPRRDGGITVEKALQQRRSRREFRKAPLSIQDISQLLWSAQGITDKQGLRTAPSAGALYHWKSMWWWEWLRIFRSVSINTDLTHTS